MTTAITLLPPGAAPPLSAMHQTCFPEEPWDEEALRRILELSGTFGYLAWQADDPTGFLLARDLGEEIEVLSLGVLPAWRRHGFGRSLLDAVAAEAQWRGRGSLVLEVAEENTAARRLYAGCGFIEVGRRPRYYGRAGHLTDGMILRRGITGPASAQ